MQYNLIASSRLGLVEDTLHLCGLPTVSASYASYPLADITRNINNAYLDTIRKIWSCADGWQYDDSNATDSPIAYKTLGDASASYLIPTTALRIEGIDVKDDSGDWHKLTQIDYEDLDVSPEEYLSTPGMPIQYDLDGNQIRLFPAPASGDVTLSSGMCVYLSREPTLFTSASTTSPGFASPFHRILSYAAAIDFDIDPQTKLEYLREKEKLEAGLIQFYSKRNVDKKPRIRPFKRLNTYR